MSSGFTTRGRIDPKRVCDLCGAYRSSSTMRTITGRTVCNWHDHFVARETLDKQPVKTFGVRPYKNAKPLAPRDTYERAEWEILNFLADGYRYNQYTVHDSVQPVPSGNAQTSYGVESAGWTCIYLYELIAEGLRPARMIEFARSTLRTVADFLVTRQYAGPHSGNAATSANPAWGGWATVDTTSYPSTCSMTTRHCAAAGLGLLRAYQILGDARYLNCARAAAWMMRTAQSAGKWVYFTSVDAGGTSPLSLGSWVRTISVDTGGGTLVSDDWYSPGELVALEFLVAYRDAIGDETIGTSTTGTFYTAAPAATVSTCINEAVSFWENGYRDINGVTNGFSISTPFEAFAAFPTNTCEWRYSDGVPASGTYASADTWARGLRGLRAAVGDSAQVTGIFDWLMGFSSNPAHALPDEYNDKFLYAPLYTNGEYDPKFALADELQLRSAAGGTAVTMSGTAVRQAYNLGCTGLLADLYSLRQQASFKSFKDALNQPRHHTVGRGEDGRYHYLGKAGRCGFSLQSTQKNGRFYVPVLAAQVGLAYRAAPKAFLGVGRA